MPITKSAAKRMVTSRIKRASNRAGKGRLATTRSQLLAASASGDKTKAQDLQAAYASQLDKAVKAGTIKANNANRHKARAAALLKKA